MVARKAGWLEKGEHSPSSVFPRLGLASRAAVLQRPACLSGWMHGARRGSKSLSAGAVPMKLHNASACLGRASACSSFAARSPNYGACPHGWGQPSSDRSQNLSRFTSCLPGMALSLPLNPLASPWLRADQFPAGSPSGHRRCRRRQLCTARTLSPCYSADLRPASDRLVSAVGCTVLLTIPPLKASEVVFWEYKTGLQEGVIVNYAFDRPANTSRPYENRTRFNETDFSLQIVLQQGDDRLYRFRSESEATGWFQLRVVEPLSEPEIVGNSSVKAGGNTKLVCNVLEGKADLYWWKKNGELLLGSDHIQFVDNTTLCIVKASMNDSGYYACVVRNEVSQNETSFLLHVQNAANVVLPVILACVIIGLLAGVFVWCRRRDRQCHNGCR
ncbi:uncharacterized protein M6G45_008676 isoform 2-T2 [Spheniscus humboldti]